MCNKENYKVAAYMKLNFGTNDLSKVEKDVKFFRDGFKRYLKMNMELDTVEFYIDNIDSNCAFEKMIKESKSDKFNLIVTYSILRFGKKGADLRRILCDLVLSEHRTDVLFIRERIHTKNSYFWTEYEKYYISKINLE